MAARSGRPPSAAAPGPAGSTCTRPRPRSPNHSGICERVQGTLLDEFYRPTFHRGVITDVGLLNRQLQAHLDRHNTRRRNHGNWMAGRTPFDVLTSDQQRAELSPELVACTA